MQGVSTFLTSLEKSMGERHLSHEWQAFAYKTWKEYSGKKDELPRIIRLFKMYHTNYRPSLDSAYNFCTDYTGRVPKIKLFLWKFWKLKKEIDSDRGAKSVDVATQKSNGTKT